MAKICPKCGISIPPTLGATCGCISFTPIGQPTPTAFTAPVSTPPKVTGWYWGKGDDELSYKPFQFKPGVDGVQWKGIHAGSFERGFKWASQDGKTPYKIPEPEGI